MRLSLLLNSFRREFIGPIPKYKGNVLIGKKRFVPKITLGKKINFFQKLAYEEEAMKYLSKSYISPEQETKYLESIDRTHPPYWDDPLRREIQEPLKQNYSADYLKKLNVSRKFQEEN